MWRRRSLSYLFQNYDNSLSPDRLNHNSVAMGLKSPTTRQFARHLFSLTTNETIKQNSVFLHVHWIIITMMMIMIILRIIMVMKIIIIMTMIMVMKMKMKMILNLSNNLSGGVVSPVSQCNKSTVCFGVLGTSVGFRYCFQKCSSGFWLACFLCKFDTSVTYGSVPF